MNEEKIFLVKGCSLGFSKNATIIEITKEELAEIIRWYYCAEMDSGTVEFSYQTVKKLEGIK